ncbi:MAG: nucleotidyltransferase domain-containing protein [Planctomycetota bacterium]
MDLKPPETVAEWDSLIGDAISRNVAGLLHEALRTKGVDIPEAPVRRLKTAAARMAGQTNSMMTEMARLVRAFNRAGIDVMLLKGAALNLSIYERPDSRGMSDIDLLVRPEDAKAACAVLEANLCRKGQDLVRPDFFPEYYYEIEYLSETVNASRIDLHVRPFRPLRYTQTMGDIAIWRHAQVVEYQGAYVFVPAATSMLIHLTAHAAFHGCSRLTWLYDIKRFVECHADDLDWDRLLRDCEDWQLATAVEHALRCTERELGPLPIDDILNRLAAAGSNWKDRLVLRQTPRDAATPLRHILVNWICTPGIEYPTRYLLANLLPSGDHLASLYPFRHFGWQLPAHLVRFARALSRPIFGKSAGVRVA